MTVSLMFMGRRVEVAESTLEIAEMAYADHGEPTARVVLRSLVPGLSIVETCAAVEEAKRRMDDRAMTLAKLTQEDIRAESAASQIDLLQASTPEDRQRAREGEECCRTAATPKDKSLVPVWEQARKQVVDRINRRRGIRR